MPVQVATHTIPHLEVLPDYRGKGIGSELVKRMLNRLEDVYMIDLACDNDVVRFYKGLEFQRVNAMVIRNFARQNCSL